MFAYKEGSEAVRVSRRPSGRVHRGRSSTVAANAAAATTTSPSTFPPRASLSTNFISVRLMFSNKSDLSLQHIPSESILNFKHRVCDALNTCKASADVGGNAADLNTVEQLRLLVRGREMNANADGHRVEDFGLAPGSVLNLVVRPKGLTGGSGKSFGGTWSPKEDLFRFFSFSSFF